MKKKLCFLCTIILIVTIAVIVFGVIKIKKIKTNSNQNNNDLIVTQTTTDNDDKKNSENTEDNNGYDYRNPVIPKGFRSIETELASWKLDEDGNPIGWDKGLVIEDDIGNQFVWIPVKDL